VKIDLGKLAARVQARAQSRFGPEPSVDGCLIRDGIPHGTKKWFEYHCWMSEYSTDAHLWHRSHQEVVVLEPSSPPEFVKAWADESFEERCDGCGQFTYRIRFSDGFVGTAFEDELLDDPSQYSFKDPPPGPLFPPAQRSRR
jgi:hypothetical protein